MQDYNHKEASSLSNHGNIRSVSVTTLTFLCVAIFSQHAMGQDAAKSTRIGQTISITNSVQAIAGPNAGALESNSPIHRGQEIVVGEKSSGGLEFEDFSRIAMGENSEIYLEKYVYNDTGDNPGELSFNAAVGNFRFVSGLINQGKAVINTPSARVGIFEGALDIHVAPNGDTILALMDGGATVCNQELECMDLQTQGWFIKVSSEGVLTKTTSWSQDLARISPFTAAFPFIVNQGPLGQDFKQPERVVKQFRAGVKRSRIKAGKVVRKAGGVVKKAGRKVGKTAGKTARKTKSVVRKIFRKPLLKRKIFN